MNYLVSEQAPTDPEMRRQTLEHVCRTLLVLLGEDPERDGLKETPRRWASMWQEFVDYKDDNAHTTFEAVTADQMVVVRGIRVWSICEHHLLPFWCDISIGYLTSLKVLGLSKFARIAHVCAHRLQTQERLVEEIADEIQQATESESVAVLATGTHMCMVARGIRTEGEMLTSVVRGEFRNEPETRAEFMRLAK